MLSNQKVNPGTKKISKEGKGSSKMTNYKGLQVFHTHRGGPCHSGPVVISPLGHWDGTEDKKHPDMLTHVRLLTPIYL